MYLMGGKIMFKGTSDLAENKLLLLYIFHRINMPMSNSHITQIILENNLINYFGLQQYISELVAAGFLNDTLHNKKHLLNLTERGTDTLNLFIGRIPDKKREVIDKYLDEHIDLIKKDISVVSDYEIENDSYMIRLALRSNEQTLMELKFPVENNANAQDISQHWKENYEELYQKIMKLFIK